MNLPMARLSRGGVSAATLGDVASRRRWLAALPLLPIAPSIVVLVGIAVAVAVTLLGVVDLRRESDQAADLRAEALASTLAARLRVTGSEDWSEIVQRTARRSGLDVLLIDQNGRAIVDGSLGDFSRRELLDCLVAGQGEIETPFGRSRFVARPLGPRLERLSVIAFVPAPETPQEAAKLASATAALTALLVGVAGAVAFVFAKDVRDDVGYVRRRIARMAKGAGAPSPNASELPALGGEGGLDDEVTALTIGGSLAPSIAKIPIRALDQIGSLTAAFNVLVDRFTAAERTYRQDLRLATSHEKSRGTFLSALSHELRTPLNAVLGFTDILLAEVDGPLEASAREDLQVVRTSAAHLASLIDDILDLSALESGKLRLERKPIDVFDIVEEIVREAEPLAAEKSLAVTLEGERGHRAFADARRVRQIVGNIIGNAVKFTQIGSVRVHVEGREGAVAVVIADTGPGIAERERAIIFEEYRQAGDLASRRKGTGLGLAIARRLVEMHEGAIELESALGEGSRFTITLPSPRVATS